MIIFILSEEYWNIDFKLIFLSLFEIKIFIIFVFNCGTLGHWSNLFFFSLSIRKKKIFIMFVFKWGTLGHWFIWRINNSSLSLPFERSIVDRWFFDYRGHWDIELCERKIVFFFFFFWTKYFRWLIFWLSGTLGHWIMWKKNRFLFLFLLNEIFSMVDFLSVGDIGTLNYVKEKIFFSLPVVERNIFDGWFFHHGDIGTLNYKKEK